MGEGRHTPGVWRANAITFDPANWAELCPAKGEVIDIVQRGEDIIACIWCGDDEGESEGANAQLIAAAPDYDTAARKMVASLGCAPDEVIAGAFGTDVLDALNDLRAAISRAETQS